MSKRPHNDASDGLEPVQKKRKGFQVGPENLPDGTWRRKAQKIKKDLIQKAKVKKAYSKIRAQEEQDDRPSYDPYATAHIDEPTPTDTNNATVELHPDRKAMLEEPETEPLSAAKQGRRDRANRRSKPGDDNVNGFNDRENKRGPKLSRYHKDFAQAEERKNQLKAKQQARDERDKDRRAMAKARRPGKDGKMKLGRQGTVLLNRVKRMVDTGKI